MYEVFKFWEDYYLISSGELLFSGRVICGYCIASGKIQDNVIVKVFFFHFRGIREQCS